MLLLIFAPFIYSKKGVYNIKRSEQYRFLTSFGFRNNSNFSYEIKSLNAIKLNLFLLSSEEFQSPMLRNLYKTCNSTNITISQINQTNYIEKKIFKWDGYIENKDVYFPLILLCSKSYSAIEISYKYSNDFSLIDFRNDSNSIVYLIFASINLFLGILWLINVCTKTEFSIPLQQIISFVPFLKAISNSLIASEWEKLKFRDELTTYETVISFIFSSLFYIVFMYSTTLAFSGWCVYRKIQMELIEKVKILMSILLIIFGFNLEKNYQYEFYGILIKIFGIFWYLQINLSYMSITLTIPDSYLFGKKMKLKFKMVQYFCFNFVMALMFEALIGYCAVYIGAVDIIYGSIVEIGIVILEIIDVFYFYLRDEYNGVQIDEEDSLPLLLIEPKRKQLIFLIKDDKNLSDI